MFQSSDEALRLDLGLLGCSLDRRRRGGFGLVRLDIHLHVGRDLAVQT